MNRSILDTDMTTLARWAGEGWRWWLAELAALVPAGWRRGGSGRGLVALVEPGVPLRLLRRGRPATARPGARATVLVPPTLVLTRPVTLPTLSAADRQHWLAFQGDRLMPFPPGAALLAVALAPAEGAAELAALPVATAAAALDAVAAVGLRAERLAVAAPDGGWRHDFLPAWRRARGERDPAQARRWWWRLAAGLFALNLLSLVAVDLLALHHEEQLVEAHGESATMARLARARVLAEQAARQRLVTRRARHDPRPLLAELARRLPPGAVVEHLAVEDGVVRLMGVARGADVLAALRGGGFAHLRATGGDTLAATPFGQPFDLSFDWPAR